MTKTIRSIFIVNDKTGDNLKKTLKDMKNIIIIYSI